MSVNGPLVNWDKLDKSEAQNGQQGVGKGQNEKFKILGVMENHGINTVFGVGGISEAYLIQNLPHAPAKNVGSTSIILSVYPTADLKNMSNCDLGFWCKLDVTLPPSHQQSQRVNTWS